MLVVIVSYRATDLTIDCLRSLEPEIAMLPRARVAVCENGTGEEAVQRLQETIEREGWDSWVSLKAINPNRGFAGGNNAIMRDALSSREPPKYLLLLNADTIVRQAVIAKLLAAAEQYPGAGIVSPRLEWPDGTPQQSCFRDRAPAYEFFTAARTGVLSKLTNVSEGTLPVSHVPMEVEWTSFACALIRREVLEQVGLLDEGFYLYFDDPDFCRRAREAGWKVLYWPQARVVHLRGQSNPVKSLSAQHKRRPRYWYESRSRYYAKHHGRTGLWAANAFWWLGRSISLVRELVGNKQPHTCEREWLDIWANWWDPVKPPPTRDTGN